MDDAGVQTHETQLEKLVARIEALRAAKTSGRLLLGIVGAPGSGKTTMAENLVAAVVASQATGFQATDPLRPWIGSQVAHVPMDGFHLADVELARLGRAERKGAPDTFDAAGYIALLDRLRRADETVWAPAFDRESEQPVAGSIPVHPGVRVVVTEGNYLLLDDPAWLPLRTLLDEIWFCHVDPDLRVQRLIARHRRFGKSAAVATAWATGPDQRNADLIEANRESADLIVTLPDDQVLSRSAQPPI
jgi:pantothenate kinase